MYQTSQRELILLFLKQSGARQISVDDALVHLAKSGHKIGRATVYRYFETLCKDGALRKYGAVHGKSAYYQYIGDGSSCGEHYHMICGECKKLFHVKCEVLDIAKQHIMKDHSFSIDNLKTTLHGVCKQCAARL